MSDFYNWVIEKYLNKRTPSGDFAYDLWRDKKALLIENNEKLFKHLNFMIQDIEVYEIYRKLRKKFLKNYYIRDKYINSIYEKEDIEYDTEIGEKND